MAAILDFAHTAMSSVRSSDTTVSHISSNTPIVHTKIMILVLFCLKLYQFFVSLCKNGGHVEY